MSLSKIDFESMSEFFDHARIIGIRWDVFPWSLVFSVDLYDEEETEGGKCLPAWYVFKNVGEIDFPIDHINLPLGIWLYSVDAISLTDRINRYEFSALLARIDEKGEVEAGAQKKISIQSHDMFCILSDKYLYTNNYGFVSAEKREAFFPDGEVIDFICAFDSALFESRKSN